MNNSIELQHICKSFRKQENVLKDISVGFEQGKIHGIVGRNGSGKTVLLKIICGLMSPTSGTVEVNGKFVGKDVDFPEDIGIIIEAPGFLPYQSGFQNLEYLASIRRKIDKEDIKVAMERVGLDPQMKKWVGKYSLGMKQRLGLAQAIMENPSLLILDEPMNGLDKSGVADMHSLFLSMKNEGKTILLVSHSNEDIDSLCDTVHEMDKGVLTRIRVE